MDVEVQDTTSDTIKTIIENDKRRSNRDFNNVAVIAVVAVVVAVVVTGTGVVVINNLLFYPFIFR